MTRGVLEVELNRPTHDNSLSIAEVAIIVRL